MAEPDAHDEPLFVGPTEPCPGIPTPDYFDQEIRRLIVGQAPDEAATLVGEVSPAPRERREVVLRVGETAVLDAVVTAGCRPHGQYRFLNAPDLPPGTSVRAVFHDPWTRCFHFCLGHPSFAVVPDGLPAPLYPHLGAFEWREYPSRRNRWAESPAAGGVIQTDVNTALIRLEGLFPNTPTDEPDVTLTISDKDAREVAASGEIRTYCASGRERWWGLPGRYGLPALLYGCVVAPDPQQPRGIVTLSAGGRAVSFSIYEERHGKGPN